MKEEGSVPLEEKVRSASVVPPEQTQSISTGKLHSEQKINNICGELRVHSGH